VVFEGQNASGLRRTPRQAGFWHAFRDGPSVNRIHAIRPRTTAPKPHLIVPAWAKDAKARRPAAIPPIARARPSETHHEWARLLSGIGHYARPARGAVKMRPVAVEKSNEAVRLFPLLRYVRQWKFSRPAEVDPAQWKSEQRRAAAARPACQIGHQFKRPPAMPFPGHVGQLQIPRRFGRREGRMSKIIAFPPAGADCHAVAISYPGICGISRRAASFFLDGFLASAISRFLLLAR